MQKDLQELPELQLPRWAVRTSDKFQRKFGMRTFDEAKSVASNRGQRVLTAHGNLKLPNVGWKKVESESENLRPVQK
jgi:hypothetical protein